MSISFVNVSKSFGDNIVLNNVSFALDDAAAYLLTGPSGAGKTTLLRLISGLDTPSSGKIDRNNHTFSYAFQETRLFPQLTVEENLIAIKPRIPVAEILSALDLSDAAGKYPSELSGGMKKRAGLARALSAAADVYLLDEPTAGQDTAHAKMVADAIRKYTSGAITVVSTHDAFLISSLRGKTITADGASVFVTK